MPALKDLPIPMRKMSPTTKKMIGIITEAPRPMMVLMISIMFLSRARGRLLRPLLCVVAPHFPSASVFDEPARRQPLANGGKVLHTTHAMNTCSSNT